MFVSCFIKKRKIKESEKSEIILIRHTHVRVLVSMMSSVRTSFTDLQTPFEGTSQRLKRSQPGLLK